MANSASSSFPTSTPPGSSGTGAASPFPTSSTMADKLDPTATGTVGDALGAEARKVVAGDTAAAGDLMNRVVQGAHQTIDRLAETAAPHVQRLQEGVVGANDSLHMRADQARELSDEWAESLRSTVRENPIAAVATALAVGLIVARLTR